MAGIKLYFLESGNSYTHYSEFFCKEDSRPKDLNGTGHHKSTGRVSDATLQLTLKRRSLGEFGVIIKEHPNIHKGY